MKTINYEENGVKLSKKTSKVGDTVKLFYDGLLKKSGASQVKVHTGYNDEWEEADYIDMVPEGEAFVTEVTIKKHGYFNCAFVDPAGNWDNNSGANYSFKVTKPRSTSTKKTADKETKTTKTSKSTKTAAKKSAKSKKA